MDLNIVWYFLIGLLLTGYAVLDGFDFGVGIWHLAVKKDEHRRILLNAIGPVWDGNEVWLVAGGGALFAAFPLAYATVFSGFYLAVIALLFALIFRAVSIEFRGKISAAWWRNLWDTCFSLASLGASFLFGVVLGNLIYRVPLTPEKEFAGSLLSLLHPYALGAGITTAALFAMHGSLYLLLKTEGELHEKIRGWAMKAVLLFSACYLVFTVATTFAAPYMFEPFKKQPWFFAIPLASLVLLTNIARELSRDRFGRAFLSSCLLIASSMALFGLGMFPNLVFSHPHPEHSLTIYNAASSTKTLSVMLVIAGMGLPLILIYTAVAYRVFRGKVKLESASY